MICAIYCRLSKEDADRTGESESIQNQKTILVSHAVSQGWEIFQIYSDEDYSGADRERPQWNAMLRDAQAGRFQVLLCKNQSRFTRDLEMVERYIHGLFPLWGIRFVALLDNIDTQQKGNKKARQISGLINEWYLEDLSENVRAVFREKRRAGKYIGSFAPYGYRKDSADHNRLAVDETAAQVVREIFRLCLEGWGKAKIASHLNERGIPSPSEYKQQNGATGRRVSPWNATAVGRILKNEMYLGRMVQGTRRKASYKSKQLLMVPPSEWVRVEGTHPPIVDVDTFAAAGELLQSRTRSDGTGEAHPLAGRVFCADCGANMIKFSHTYKGERRSYLQCAAYAADRKQPVCTRHSIRLDRLCGAIIERTHYYTSAWYDVGDSARFRQDRGASSPAAALQKEVSSLRGRIEKLDSAMRNLYLDRSEGVIDTTQFQEMNTAFLAEKKALAQRLERLTKELETNRETKAETSLDEVARRLARPQELNRLLCSLLIRQVEVGERNPETGRQRIRIHWNW